MLKFEQIKTYYSLLKSHLTVQICTVSYTRNYIGWSTLLKKVMTLNAVTSLTAYFIMDIFLQVLQNFRNTAVFKSICKITFCQ